MMGFVTQPDTERSNRIYKSLLFLAQFFCAAPILNNSNRHLLGLHCIWCTVVVSTVFIATCYNDQNPSTSKSTIQKILTTSESITRIILIVLIVTTVYYNKDYYKQFPKRIQEISRRIGIYRKALLSQPTRMSFEVKLALIASALGVFFSAYLALDVLFSPNIYIYLQRSIAYVVPNLIISLMIGQYWVLIKIITNLHRQLNEVLEDLRHRLPHTLNPFPDLSAILETKTKPRSSADLMLDDLRVILGDLDTLVSDVNSVFGLMITTTFLGSFLTLSILIFFLYKISDNGIDDPWFLSVYALVWIAFHAARFTTVLSVNNLLLDELADMGTILKDFDVVEPNIEDALQRFLIQLAVKRSNPTACGIIQLDTTFLGGILSALSIYVIFLVQVDLGEITLSVRDTQNTTTPKTGP